MCVMTLLFHGKAKSNPTVEAVLLLPAHCRQRCRTNSLACILVESHPLIKKRKTIKIKSHLNLIKD